MSGARSRWLGVAILAFVASAAALSSAQSSPTVEQQILKADRDRFAAMVNGDVATLDRLLAIELSYIHTSARIEDKHAYLYGIKSGKTKYWSIIPTERQVHVMGTVATVVGVAVVRGEDNDPGIDVGIRYTAVYVLRDGRWQMVAWQSTRIVPNDTVNPRIG
jgi:ketosteroid isomerase-like protein